MDKVINAAVKAALYKDGTAISPYIYGGFVEYIRDCVNPGICAQLITDRSFETPGEGEKLLKHWCCRATNDTCRFSLAERQGGGKCLSLEVLDHFGGRAIVHPEARLRLLPGEYILTGQVRQSEDFEGRISITIGEDATRQSFDITGHGEQWRDFRHEFKISSAERTKLEICVEGTGRVCLDELSLVPRDTVDGVWREIAKRTDALHCGILRYPGGCFADVYDWRDGVGERRVFKENAHWGGMEDNSFGTDEFMHFCENVHCEAMMCVNFGSGTPELAASWVEYCNGSTDTPYGAMRAKNGHAEPYNIRYWEIGNENYGEWEVGNCNADEFCRKFELFCRAMKKADPKIEIIACGTNGYDASLEWNDKLMALQTPPDIIALHYYAPQTREQLPHGDDIYYGTVASSVKLDSLLRTAARQMRAAGARPRIAVTEWNAMYINSSFRERTMEAALLNAGLLLAFIKNADITEIANFSDLVNGWEGACIINDRGRVYCTPSYYAIKLFSASGAAKALETEIECESYHVKHVGHLENIDAKYVDGAVCLAEDGERLFVINRSLTCSAQVSYGALFAGAKELCVSILTAKPHEFNSFDAESVVPHDERQGACGYVTLPPCSVAAVRAI